MEYSENNSHCSVTFRIATDKDMDNSKVKIVNRRHIGMGIYLAQVKFGRQTD